MAGSFRNRIIFAGVNRMLDVPASSWVFSTVAVASFNFLRGRAGKRQVIDLSGAPVGDMFVIEHLPITHKQQMKQAKREAKAEKREAKALKVERKRIKKTRRPGWVNLRHLRHEERMRSAKRSRRGRSTRPELWHREHQSVREDHSARLLVRVASEQEKALVNQAKTEARKLAKAERIAAKEQRARRRATHRAEKAAKAAAKARAEEDRRAAKEAKKAKRAARKSARAERREAHRIAWQARRDARNAKVAQRYQKRADRARARLEKD